MTRSSSTQCLKAWLVSPQGRALSLSLPFTAGNQPLHGPIVHNYFDNLLPDSDAIRRRLHARFRTLSTEAESARNHSQSRAASCHEDLRQQLELHSALRLLLVK